MDIFTKCVNSNNIDFIKKRRKKQKNDLKIRYPHQSTGLMKMGTGSELKCVNVGKNGGREAPVLLFQPISALAR
jgi:hypothetical protein